MRLSIFTTISDYENNHWKQSLQSYLDLADEVVIISGNIKGRELIMDFLVNADTPEYILKVKDYYCEWPEGFSFDFIGKQFQRGYEACTGDWVIHADIDFVFHENDIKDIGRQLENLKDEPVISMYKYQFILPDRFILKSRTPIIVNKGRFGDRIKFDSGGDLCQPSLDGKQVIDPPCLTIPFYNYEHLTKTKEVIEKEIGRMERAYRRTFGKKLYGDDYFDGWMKMMQGRIKMHGQPIPLSDHPKYIQETIKSLKPDQFGYSNFGKQKCSYTSQA